MEIKFLHKIKSYLFSKILFIVCSWATINSNVNAQVNFATTDYEIEAKTNKIVSGDFDNDGNLDIILDVFYGTHLYFLKGNPNGIFNNKIEVLTGLVGDNSRNGDIVTGDFNNDGNLDLAFHNQTTLPYTNKIVTIFGTGTGTFTNKKEYSYNEVLSENLNLADFNSDGVLDLVFYSTERDFSINPTSFSKIYVMTGNINGTFNPALIYNFQNTIDDISLFNSKNIVGDFNGDSKPDLAFIINHSSPLGGKKHSLCLLFGNGMGSFTNKVFYNILNESVFVLPEIAKGDFNKDGIDDIALANNGINVFMSNRITGFLNYFIDEYNLKKSISVADINNDGNLDILAGTGCTSIFTGNGMGNFTENPYKIEGNLNVMLSADFNKDGKTDIGFGSRLIFKTLLNKLGEPDLSSIIVAKQPTGSGNTLTITGYSLGATTSVAFIGSNSFVSPTFVNNNTVVVNVPADAVNGPFQIFSGCRTTSGVYKKPKLSIIVSGTSTKLYGQSNPVFTTAITGLIGNDAPTITYQTTALLSSPIGSYTVTPVLNGIDISDYDVTLTPFTLTILPVPITITATDSRTKIYGTINPVFTSAITGLVGLESFTVAYNTVATTASTPGIYPVTATLTGLGIQNYLPTIISPPLTITPVQLTLSPAVAAASRFKVYGSTNPEFITEVIGVVGTDVIDINYSTIANNLTKPGIYSVIPIITGPSAANYTMLSPALTITPAPVSVTVLTPVGGLVKAYGAPNPLFTSSVIGLIGTDDLTIVYNTASNNLTGVGTYAVTPELSGTALAYYTLAVVNPSVITITPAPLTVTVLAPVGGLSKVYGSANPVFTSKITGLVGTDILTVTYNTLVNNFSGVGTYTVSPELNGTALPNYSVLAVPSLITVTPAPLSVAVVTPVGGLTKIYGTANPIFTSQITGLVGTDTLTVTYNTAATNITNVGTYNVIPQLAGTALPNYSLSGVLPSVITITPATLTVTASDSRTKVYGAANPVFASTINGLVGTDNLAINYTTTANNLSGVGTYAVNTTITSAKLANYNLALTSPALTITPAPLTVTASDSRTKVYGTANPVFASTVTGLIGADKVNVAHTTIATNNTLVGTYPVTTAVTGAALNNYALAVNSPVLTITPAKLTVSTCSFSKVYGTANPKFNGSITSGIVGNDKVTVTTYSTANNLSDVGNYSLFATLAGISAANYYVAPITGKFTINKANLKIKITQNYTRQYGQNNPIFTGLVTGLVPNDGATVAYNTTANRLSAEGVYPVVATLTGTAAKNYQTTVENATITILPRRYEAEVAQLTGNALVANAKANFSATGYVTGYTANGAGTNFTNVNTLKTGTYSVRLGYNNSSCGGKKVAVYVNGIRVLTPTLSSSNNWIEMELQLDLLAGNNSIKFQKDSNTDEGNFNLDYITVPSTTIVKKPKQCDNVETDLLTQSVKPTEINIYPNPAINSFTVDLPTKNTKITVVNLQGKVMKVINEKNNQSFIDSQNWTSGMYILKIQTDAETIIKKVMIQK